MGNIKSSFTPLNVGAEAGGGNLNYFLRDTITAEENGALSNGHMEFSFGNGDTLNTAHGHGFVPNRDYFIDGWSISARIHGNAVTRVEIYKNGVGTGVILELQNGVLTNSAVIDPTLITGVNGDTINFRTINAGAASDVIVNAFVHYLETTSGGSDNGGGGNDCAANFDVSLSYNPFFGGFNAQFTITNNGTTDVTGWCVTVEDGGNAWDVTNDFGQSVHTDFNTSGIGGPHEFCDAGYNGTILAGQTITVGFGGTTGFTGGVQSPNHTSITATCTN